MSHWVTPAGFLSSTPNLPDLTNGHAGPASDASFYATATAVGVIALMIVAVVAWSVARHIGVTPRTGRRRITARDRAASRAHAPSRLG